MSYLTDGVRRGTFANRPATAPDGTIYVCTDGQLQFIRKGGAWNPFFGSMPMSQAPTASNFTVFQTGTNGTISDDAGGLLFAATQRITTTDGIVAGQNNPGGTGAAYTLTVGFIPNPGEKNGSSGFFNYHVAGISVYNSSTTQLRYMMVYTQADGAFRFQLGGKTGLTGTATTTFDVGGYPLISGPMIWLRVKDDGTTNRIWYVSTDGKHFYAVSSEARTTGFSSQPDKIGLYLDPLNADARMNVLSYQLTSP